MPPRSRPPPPESPAPKPAGTGRAKAGPGPAKAAPRGPQPLGQLVAGLMTPAARRQGFAQVELLSRWPQIVGERLGRNTAPVKLSWPRGREDGATLHILATGPAALELQHGAGPLIERINAYLGHRAVDRIAMAQGYAGRLPTAPRPAPPADAAQAQAATLVSSLDPGPLRDALARLGAEILNTRR